MREPVVLKEEPKQGLRYNQGKPHWGLVDFESLLPLVQVLEYGKEKYTVKLENGQVISGAHNWKKGLDQDLILESLARHLFALMNGQLNDPESGLSHIGHIMCNAMFWSYFENKKNK